MTSWSGSRVRPARGSGASRTRSATHSWMGVSTRATGPAPGSSQRTRCGMSADRVRLRYDDREIPGRSGERLLDVILDAGIEHRHICGGRGFCTSCRVEVVAGSENLSPVSALERERLGPQAGKLRLA